MIDAANMTIEIGGRTLLRDVSVGVGAGEVTAVIGPNGAGKSTLLKALAGDLAPRIGAVSMNGKALAEMPPEARAKQRAVLPQESTLAFPFTTLEVVLMGRMPHHETREGRLDLEIVREAMALTGVCHLERRVYPTLSGGERQRVHLARVLSQIWESAATPRFLLLDEPTASLDLSHQHDTLAITRDFASRGVGALVVLHDLNLAAQYADRIVLLSNGAIQAEGTPEQVLNREIISAVFGVDVEVLPHPRGGFPHVMTFPKAPNPRHVTGSGGARANANIFTFRRITKGFSTR